MYVTQMLNDLADRARYRLDYIKPAPMKRNTEKARKARKEKVRKWFRDNMGNQRWSTTQISSKRGQNNSSCLPLLYDLETEGFLKRVGEGVRTGRGKCPILWELTNPPIEEEENHDLHDQDCGDPLQV